MATGALARQDGHADPVAPFTPPPDLARPRRPRELLRRAARVAGRAWRDDLLALYGYARLVDWLGDEYDRRPRCRARLGRGRARSRTAGDADTEPVLARTASHRPPARPVSAAVPRPHRGQPPDQVVHDYATFDDLLGYCRLSANPVGRIVLRSSGRHAGADRAVRRRLHGAAAGRALAGRRRGRPGRPRVPAGRGPARTFGVAEDELTRRPAPRRRCAPLMRLEIARAPRPCSTLGRRRCAPPCRVAPAGSSPGSCAGGPRRARRASSAPTATCSAVAAGRGRRATTRHRRACCGSPPGGGGADERRRRRPTPSAARITAQRRRGTSPTASGCCRPPSGDAMSAVYALARRIDDIGDGDLPLDREARRARPCVREQLGDARAAPRRPGAGRARRRRRPLPRSRSTRSRSSIDGCELDVDGVRLRDFDDLVGYCRRVAGSIGRLSLGVFGTARPGRGRAAYADALGIALQLTNILRDVARTGERPRLPARARTRTASAARPTCRARRRRLDRRSSPLRGRPRRELVRRGPAAAAAARPAQRGLRRGDGRHLPAAARPHRSRPRPSVLRERRLAPGAGRRSWVAARSLARWVGLSHRARLGAGSSWSAAASPGSPPRSRCADAGAAVTLLEARPRLGGLTFSFRRDGLDVDNGQHVFLRCCTAYRAFLERLGGADLVDAAGPARRPGRWPRGAGPAGCAGPACRRRCTSPARSPRYRPLAPPTALRAVRAALRAAERSIRADPATDAVTFGDWLAGTASAERAIEALWDLVGLADPQPAGRPTRRWRWPPWSSRPACSTDADAADIGWAGVPLGVLHGDAAARGARRGAASRCVTSTRVESRSSGGADGGRRPDRREGRHGTPTRWSCAVTAPRRRRALAAAAALARRAGDWDPTGSAASPIVNVHVVYDRRVTRPCRSSPPSTSPVQWVFDRTARRPARTAAGSTSPSRCRRPTSCIDDTRPTSCAPRCRAALGELLPGGARRPGARLLRHPGARTRRSGSGPGSAAPPRRRRRPARRACTSPARGPTPAGPPRWRARCAAAHAAASVALARGRSRRRDGGTRRDVTAPPPPPTSSTALAALADPALRAGASTA